MSSILSDILDYLTDLDEKNKYSSKSLLKKYRNSLTLSRIVPIFYEFTRIAED